MSSEKVPSRVLYEDLDTSFVNLWGLLRYLSQRSFVGRVHVELTDYEADVFLDGSETPLVHEIDRAVGTDVVEEAALHRLVLFVRESQGKISVYEGAEEAVAPRSQSSPSIAQIPAAATPESMRSSDLKDKDDVATETSPAQELTPTAKAEQTIKLSGELIAAVEQAATAQAAKFAELFRQARITLGDDYTFLDPIGGSLDYKDSSVTIKGGGIPQGFVTGICEVLRRVVDQLATGDRARRTRERVALELARVARKNTQTIEASGFKEQLDRIAGTKVI